jgi:hypothetical protein
MNSLLLRHLPKDYKKEEFIKQWENSGLLLSPIAGILEEIIKNKSRLKEEDFSSPNHYELLAFRGGEIELAEKILALLPSSAKSK